MSTIRNVIIGTAGHIDHGKSSLVKALTGIDPDRLVEERERGMTIDLGFARYEHRSGALAGIIDVPGHERFIRNMVAGATSVDVVMLVVAADDGVMPQTREHLEILSLLGVEAGLVVVSKIDLVEPDLFEMSLDDIRGFVAGTFLESAPMLPFSAVTGEGLADVRAAVDALVDEVPARDTSGPFRVPVQRVFSAPGHGTVVTGVPVSGQVEIGDRLEVVGGDRTLRVRGLQAYGSAREVAHAGHSTALNVTGIARAEVSRGDVVATPGIFEARRRILVSYRHVEDQLVLRNRHPVRLHVGTLEALGRAVVLDGPTVERGSESFVQLRLDQPVVVAPGDRFLIRDAASLRLLGGGKVLAASDGRLKRFKERVLGEARRRRDAGDDPLQLTRVAVSTAGRRGRLLAELAIDTALDTKALSAQLDTLVESKEVERVGQERYLDAAVLAEIGDDVVAALRRAHKAQPLMEWLSVASVRSNLDVDDAVLDVALRSDRRVETAPGGRVRRQGHTVQLGAEVAAARERILEALQDAGATPPPIDQDFTGLPAKQSRALIEMMRAAGEVSLVSGQLFGTAVLDRLRRTLVEHGRARDGDIDIPSLRDELGTTRKYLIPLLEHFDSEGVTVRHGDRRVLRQTERGS